MPRKLSTVRPVTNQPKTVPNKSGFQIAPGAAPLSAEELAARVNIFSPKPEKTRVAGYDAETKTWGENPSIRLNIKSVPWISDYKKGDSLFAKISGKSEFPFLTQKNKYTFAKKTKTRGGNEYAYLVPDIAWREEQDKAKQEAKELKEWQKRSQQLQVQRIKDRRQRERDALRAQRDAAKAEREKKERVQNVLSGIGQGISKGAKAAEMAYTLAKFFGL